MKTNTTRTTTVNNTTTTIDSTRSRRGQPDARSLLRSSRGGKRVDSKTSEGCPQAGMASTVPRGDIGVSVMPAHSNMHEPSLWKVLADAIIRCQVVLQHGCRVTLISFMRRTHRQHVRRADACRCSRKRLASCPLVSCVRITSGDCD